jgi:transposase
LSRGDLTGVEWRILQMLLPVAQTWKARPRASAEDNHNIIDGILLQLRTGAWRDFPEKYGKWNSIYRRFRRWSASGAWESVAIALAEAMAESGHYGHRRHHGSRLCLAAGGRGGSSTSFWPLAGRVHQ